MLADRYTHRIISTGYVGVAAGDPGCLSGACPRGLATYGEIPPYSDYSNCISTHAEQNCLDYAVRWYGETYDFSTTRMYVTRMPCRDCIAYCQLFDVNDFYWRELADAQSNFDR